MFRIILCIMIVAYISLATTRTEVVKVPKPDTVKTLKTDTLISVIYDTLQITNTYKDTSILVKSDTIKVPMAKPTKVSEHAKSTDKPAEKSKPAESKPAKK